MIVYSVVGLIVFFFLWGILDKFDPKQMIYALIAGLVWPVTLMWFILRFIRLARFGV